jgi:hypothetical protein
MAKDHGPSVKDDKQYEGLRKKGMSKSRAAAIANSPGLLQPGRQELRQYSKPPQQRERQRREPRPEGRRRAQGRQEVQRITARAPSQLQRPRR